MIASTEEIKMSKDRHLTRINILEIKMLIGKRMGSTRAEKYFGLLESYFSFKLCKSEFDKLCIAAIGRENLPLHNRLIRSILKNACLSKTPPPKRSKLETTLPDKVANGGYQRTCIQSLCRDGLPPSSRRGRTPSFRDRKNKDRPSPLGPQGKPNADASKDLGQNQKTLEQQSATELLSLGSRPIEVISVEDGEEVDQAAISPGINSRSPVTPPLGVRWNGKGHRKLHGTVGSLFSSSVNVETCHGNGELLSTDSSLRKRLEQKLEKEEMKVSVDCVNLLNNGLDAFLKRLIKPSLELAASRVGSQHPNLRGGNTVGLNGVWPVEPSPLPSCSVSLLDFRTAMELNPRLLGEDWPIQLERVCLREFEGGGSD